MNEKKLENEVLEGKYTVINPHTGKEVERFLVFDFTKKNSFDSQSYDLDVVDMMNAACRVINYILDAFGWDTLDGILEGIKSALMKNKGED